MRQRGLVATNTVLILICFMYAITYIDRVNTSTAASVFQQELHLSTMQVGLVFSAFAYPYLLFQLVGGWVSDRFGARFTLTVSGVIWALATLLTGLSGGLFTMLCARVLLGFGEGATFPAATRAMSDWTKPEKRGFSQGITHSSSRLGNALTPPLVVWLMSIVTWRGSFIILGIVSLAWAMVWVWYFRDNPKDHPQISMSELEQLPEYGSRQLKSNEAVPWRPLIKRMLPVTAVYFCYGWTLWLYLAWIPSFFVHSYRMDLRKSSFFSAGVFFAGVLGDALGGATSDWILRRTGSFNMARRNLIAISYMLSVCFTVPILFTHVPSRAAIFLSLGFFFSELTIGPMWAIPMDIAPQFSGSASGLMNIGSAMAAVLSPLAFGLVIDKTGNWQLPFIGSIGLLFAGSFIVFCIKSEDTLVAST